MNHRKLKVKSQKLKPEFGVTLYVAFSLLCLVFALSSDFHFVFLVLTFDF